MRTLNVKFEVTEQVLERIDMLAFCGMTQRMICDYFGFDAQQWATLRRKNAEIEKAYMRGRAKGSAEVLGRLMRLVKANNFSAIKLYLEIISKITPEPEIDETAPQKIESLRLGTKDPIEAARRYQDIMQIQLKE